MPWFKSNQQQPDSSQPEPEYSLDKVNALLDQIGQMRLRVTDPRLKVLMTLVARNGEAHLRRNSPNGNPAYDDIMQLQENLSAALRVLEQYITIQNDLGYPNRTAHLRAGFEAIDGLAARVLSRVTPSGSAGMTTFNVDTSILSAQRYS